MTDRELPMADMGPLNPPMTQTTDRDREAELDALAVRVLRDYRRRDGLTCYNYDSNRLRDEKYMKESFAQIVAPFIDQSTTAMAAEIERLKGENESWKKLHADNRKAYDEACADRECLRDRVVGENRLRAEIDQLRREKAEAMELLREAGSTSVRLEYTSAWHARRRTFLGQQEQRT